MIMCYPTNIIKKHSYHGYIVSFSIQIYKGYPMTFSVVEYCT